MNICSVIYAGRPDKVRSGTGITLWKQSRELVKLGCNVYIVYDRRFSPDLPSETIIDGIYMRGVNARFNLPFIGPLTFAIQAVKVLREMEQRFSIDIYAFYGPGSTLVIPLFRKYTNKPFVYHTYAALAFEAKTYLLDIINKSFSTFLRNSLMYAFYILWEYNALKYINRLIVPTSKTVEEFEKYYHYSSSLVSIVPLGQDLFDRYGLNIENKKINKFKGKKVLLFVGTSGWYRKGAWYLLLAFRIVHSRIPNTILVLTGPPVKPLTILARKLKLTNSIIFTGEIDEKTLAELYAVSDIFLLPSFHEGFSQTVVEAMAFGNPVVTTPIAGYPTVTEGIEGFIVKPNDYKSIAISIIRLLENKELYDKMSNNAMEKAKKYTWRASAEKLLAIYEAVLKSHNASINITNNR